SHPISHDGQDDVRGPRVLRLAGHQRLFLIGRREIRSGVRMRVVDDPDLVALLLEPRHAKQILRMHGEGSLRVSRVALRIPRMERFRLVPAREDLPPAATRHPAPAPPARILGNRLLADRRQLLRCENHRAPPASAGMIATPSRSVPPTPPANAGMI